MTKVLLNIMLVLPDMTMEPLNVRKNKETTECDKSTVTCDVSTVTCDVGTAQCENGTIKCEGKKKGNH